MYNDKCGNHDCFDCNRCIALGEVYFCLTHRIQIVPTEGLQCYKWEWDGREYLDANDAVEHGE